MNTPKRIVAVAEYFSRVLQCQCHSQQPPRFLSTLTPLLLPPPSTINNDETEKKQQNQESEPPPPPPPPPSTAAEVFLRWGCSDSDLSYLTLHRPSLLRISPSSLSRKLTLLRSLNLLQTPSDLLRVVTTRPRLLHRRLSPTDDLLSFLSSLFPSPPLLRSALLRNPSLLSYPVATSLLPCAQLYASLHVPPSDLARLLLTRPTVVPRSVLSPDKLLLLRLLPLPPSSPLYKYAVSIVLISRLDTLRAKISNLEKFGFSNPEVMSLFARSPNVLTLSVDKVQRNMTYVTGIMKLPAAAVLRAPLLLQVNLERLLKPRYLVGVRLKEMGIVPGMLDGEKEMVKAMRMKEPRFLKVFVTCHGGRVGEDLLEFYNGVKGSKRLAESARKATRKGFPF